MVRITAAESQIIEALWTAGPQTGDELIAGIGAAQGWGAATVKTLINRLLKKQAVASARVAGRAQYQAIVTRDDYVTSESQGLLDRLFEGQVAPLVAHFARHRPLSADEITQLRAIIDDMADGD